MLNLSDAARAAVTARFDRAWEAERHPAAGFDGAYDDLTRQGEFTIFSVDHDAAADGQWMTCDVAHCVEVEGMR